MTSRHLSTSTTTVCWQHSEKSNETCNFVEHTLRIVMEENLISILATSISEQRDIFPFNIQSTHLSNFKHTSGSCAYFSKLNTIIKFSREQSNKYWELAEGGSMPKIYFHATHNAHATTSGNSAAPNTKWKFERLHMLWFVVGSPLQPTVSFVLRKRSKTICFSRQESSYSISMKK